MKWSSRENALIIYQIITTTGKFFMEVKQISWQNVYVDIKGWSAKILDSQ